MEKELLKQGRKLSADAPFHMPPPAQPVNATVKLVVENAPGAPQLVLRDRRRELSWRLDMVKEGDVYKADVMMPMEPTLVYYRFEFPDGKILQEQRQVEGHNRPVYHSYETLDFQLTVYDPEHMPAEWTQGMLLYQIYPDSFARGRDEITRPQYGPYGNELVINDWDAPNEHPPLGRDFYGGDLQGVLQKMDYLKELGVDCIYFCPVFHSPTNHRYDAIDYLKIDPMLGTEEDLVAVVEAAHERGIKIVLDAVYNHCSCDSIYFDIPKRTALGAYHNRQSPYFRWFNFEDWPKRYQSWENLSHMPEFVECPEVEDFFFGKDGVTSYWLNKGIDGWRTDVTGDNTEVFWRRFRSAVDKLKPDAYLVSEYWINASHYLAGDMFSATMNYRFAWSLEGFFAVDELSASQFEDRLATLRRDTPAPALHSQMNLVGSHDCRRILSACQEDKTRLKQVAAFQMSYPGAPMIYYGDETGLTGDYSEASRKAYPWGKEDADLMAFYHKLTHLRNAFPALRKGDYETLLVDDERRLHAFARELDGQQVIAVYNAGDEAAEMSVPVKGAGVWRDVLEFCSDATAENGLLGCSVPARSMAWYVQP
jgi:cyclomaltodextrinase / maltogenic alpha-amylase / neopullulanase